MGTIARQGEREAFDFWAQTGDTHWHAWWRNHQHQVGFWCALAQTEMVRKKVKEPQL